jgi:hypothetical protein
VPQVTLKKEMRSAEELFIHSEKSVMILACVVAMAVTLPAVES